MNKVILMGRLTRDPDVKYSNGEQSMAIARYTLAVDRRFKKSGDEQTADFISCVAFGKAGEFAEKYFHKGIKIAVSGRIQTGKYTNKDGQTVYTTDVIVDDQEFAESKNVSGNTQTTEKSETQPPAGSDDFMNVPADIDDEVPFAEVSRTTDFV